MYRGETDNKNWAWLMTSCTLRPVFLVRPGETQREAVIGIDLRNLESNGQRDSSFAIDLAIFLKSPQKNQRLPNTFFNTLQKTNGQNSGAGWTKCRKTKKETYSGWCTDFGFSISYHWIFNLDGGFRFHKAFIFTANLGEISNLTNIFQRS